MPRHEDGPQGRRARGLTLLRAVAFALAVALAVIAIWLIVTSSEQKRIEIGILAGLWGLLLGAFAVFGARRPSRTSTDAGTEIELRRSTELERVAEAAARREHEQRLEQLLGREVRNALSAGGQGSLSAEVLSEVSAELHSALSIELAGLRSEIAALRNELVEKVGGQLRLEHTETTRIIGSDIEALQHEVNQLKASRRRAELERITVSPSMVSPSFVDVTALRGSDAEAAAAEPTSAEPASAESAPAERTGADPLAGLPRITPFTEFELDPPADAVPADGEGNTADRAGADDDETAGAPDSGSAAAGSGGDGGGRHASHEETGSEPVGGHRRRESDEGEDLLARILRRNAIV